MTAYDAPGITDPENVDSLTHQQIYDAFQTVSDSCADVATTWQQAGSQWRTSTTGLVQAVRSAVDGHWTGTAADAAVQAVTGYGNQAGELADLFEQTGQVVSTTAQAALTTKAYIPKPVPVSADPTKDPTGFDSQTRSARKAQDDARQTMRQRYVVPFTDQDGRIPTYPPANLTTPGDPVTAMRAAFTNNGAPACVPGLTYDSTHAAGLDTDTPGPEPTRPSVESILDHPESLLHDPDSVLHDPESLLHNPESSLNGSSVPTASQVLFDHTGPARFSPDGGPQLPQAAHSHTLDTGLPADPAATHSGTDSPVAAPSGAPHGPGFDQPQPQHDQPHVEQTGYDLPRHDHLSPDQPITPAADGTTPSATGWHPGRDSLVVPPDPGSSTGTTPPTGGPVPADPTGSGTPDAGRAAGPGLTPIPQDAPRLGSAVPGMVPQPSMPGPSLGTPPPIPVAPIPPVPSAPSMPPPLSGTPPPLPNAPLPTAPSPIPSTPIPSTPIPSTPIPSTPFPAPNLGSPAPGAPAPTPGPSPQPPSNPPAPNSPAPKPISNLPGAPATTVSHPGAAPGTPSALPPDVLAEPAAAAVTGAAVVEAGDEPHHHDDPRLPRLRVRYEGDRDRLRKQVDLKQDSDSADMARTGEHVQPTIGE